MCTLSQYQQQTAEPNRYNQALETLQMAEREVNRLIEELQNTIKEHNAKGEALKRQSLSLPPNENQDHREGDDVMPETGNGEKGKEREHSPTSNDEDTPRTVLDEEHATRRRALQQRLREIRLVLHRVKFLQGDVYHVLGSQHSAAEVEAYGIADEIRRDLLKGSLISAFHGQSRLIIFTGPEEDANRSMQTLNLTRIGREGISSPDLHIEVPFLSDDCKAQRSRELVFLSPLAAGRTHPYNHNNSSAKHIG